MNEWMNLNTLNNSKLGGKPTELWPKVVIRPWETSLDDKRKNFKPTQNSGRNNEKFCEFLPKRFSLPVCFRFGRFALLFRFVPVSALCWPNTLTALKLPVMRLPMYCGTILNAPDPILHKSLDSVCCLWLIRLFKQRHPKCSSLKNKNRKTEICI